MADEFKKVGSKVRDLKVTLTDGSEKKLSQLMGKNGMILYFYPKDNTPGCTKEACSFRDENAPLKKEGYTTVGVSKDSVASHQKFSEKYELNFPLISDPDLKLIQEMGVWQEKTNYGKKYMGIVRSTFILDSDLKVKQVIEKVKTNTHGSDLLTLLKENDQK